MSSFRLLILFAFVLAVFPVQTFSMKRRPSCASLIRDTWVGNVGPELAGEVIDLAKKILVSPSVHPNFEDPTPTHPYWGAPMAALLQSYDLPRSEVREFVRPILENNLAGILKYLSSVGIQVNLEPALRFAERPPVLLPATRPLLVDSLKNFSEKWKLDVFQEQTRNIGGVLNGAQREKIRPTMFWALKNLELAVYTDHIGIAKQLLALIIFGGHSDIAVTAAASLRNESIIYALILHRISDFLSHPLSDEDPAPVLSSITEIHSPGLRELTQDLLKDFAWHAAQQTTFEGLPEIKRNLLRWGMIALTCSGTSTGRHFTELGTIEKTFVLVHSGRENNLRVEKLVNGLLGRFNTLPPTNPQLNRAILPLLDFAHDRQAYLDLADSLFPNLELPDDRSLSQTLFKVRLLYRAKEKERARDLADFALRSYFNDVPQGLQRANRIITVMAEDEDYEGLDVIRELADAEKSVPLYAGNAQGEEEAPSSDHLQRQWALLSAEIDLMQKTTNQESFLRYFRIQSLPPKPAAPWQFQEDAWFKYDQNIIRRSIDPMILASLLNNAKEKLKAGRIKAATNGILLARKPESIIEMARAIVRKTKKVQWLATALDYYAWAGQMVQEAD
jgi:hypothetical protein